MGPSFPISYRGRRGHARRSTKSKHEDIINKMRIIVVAAGVDVGNASLDPARTSPANRATRCPRGWATVCDPSTRPDARRATATGSCTVVHARHRPRPALSTTPRQHQRDPRGSSAGSPGPQRRWTMPGVDNRARPWAETGPQRPDRSTGRTRLPTPLDNASRRPIGPLPIGSSDALTTSTTAATTTNASRKAANTYRFGVIPYNDPRGLFCRASRPGSRPPNVGTVPLSPRQPGVDSRWR
jgi:hypothetical protein